MQKRYIKKASVFIAALLACLIALPAVSALAFTRQKDDSDLTKINVYQFTMTRENMTVLSQGSAIKKVEIPASDTGKKPSTAFVAQPTKNGSDQAFDQPLSLKFSNAGTVNGKSVDVYVTVNSLNLKFKSANADYNNPNKTDVPFLTVDENWGTKSFQIMDYIDVHHASYTNDMQRAYAVDATVTAELRYSDGTPCDLKMVMRPSDIDVMNGDTNETFSVVNASSTIDRLVMNNRNVLTETTSGDTITWHPTRATNNGDDEEQNLSGFAFKATSNKVTFKATTGAISGSLFGMYTEALNPPPVKEVNPAEVPAKAGETITYTGTFTMPRPGIDTIGDLDSMSMVDTFDDRLDFQSLSVTLDSQTLTEGTDYTVTKEGQKVTVNIDKHLLTKGNGGKKYVITYKAVTNSKVTETCGNIENTVTQNVDRNQTSSNKVSTELLYEKDHKFVSGTPGKELPQEVLDLLPGNQTGIKNGTTVTPDQPLDGKTRVTTSDGTWVFMGYDKDSQTIDCDNAHFTGVWVIEPQPKKDVLDADGNTIDGNKVKPGQTLTYSVTYTNTTNITRDVTVTDAIPEHTTYVKDSADNGGVYDEATNKVAWKKSVASGETWTVTFKVKVDKGTKDVNVVNTAHVSDGLIDTDTNTTTNPVPPRSRKPVPDTGDNSLQYVLMTGGVGAAVVLLAVAGRKRHASKG